MCVGRGSRPLTYRQIVVRVSLATLTLAAISLADGLFFEYGSGLTTLFWVCASGWLVLLFLAGVLATRATGSVEAGAAAGLVVGLVSSVVYLVVWSTLNTLLHPSTGFVICDLPCAPPQPSFATVEDGIINGLFVCGIPVVLVSGGCGLLGGLLSRLLHRLRRSQASSTHANGSTA